MQVRLVHVLKEIKRQTDSSQNLIAMISALGIPRIQTEIIAELAFLRVFIAWENFLEESFVRYLVGATSPSKYRPKSFVHPSNMKIAMKILLSSERAYIRWNSASEVIARAEIYFRNGEPYKNVLQGATTEFDEMNTIRNRIAHKSAISQKKFNDFAREKLGHGKPGMTPGRFLLTYKSTPHITFLSHYINVINTASTMIVP